MNDRYLEEVDTVHFGLHYPTFSDFSIVAVLFFMDPCLSENALQISDGFRSDQTADSRKQQVQAIQALCKYATASGYQLRPVESCREMALAFVFFCRTYCDAEVGRIIAQWQLTNQPDPGLRQRELLRFFCGRALQWSSVYHELAPSLIEVNQRCLELYPETRLWSLDQLPTDDSTQTLSNGLLTYDEF